MSERLTERNANGTAKGRMSATCLADAWQNETDILERLCDLEDKIEQGKILELPCKVGQTVYVPWVWEGQEGIASTIVECIQIVRDAELCGFFIDMKSNDAAFNDVYGFWRTFADIGKTVFLDRAKAEAKLREMEGIDNEKTDK